MGKVLAIANQKGGVGKTTTAVNLCDALSRENKKVLLIDLDEQANATIGLGISRELVEVTSYELLVTDISIRDAIYFSIDNDFDFIPASIKLSEIEGKLHGKPESRLTLARKVDTVKDEYDFIIIDCPPSLGSIIDNALFASDAVIIPVECDYYAYDALTQIVNKINQIQKQKRKYNRSLTIEGILMTKLDNRNIFGYKIVDKVKDLFPSKMFKTIINRSSHIQEAPMYGKTVLKYAYTSRGSKEYRELAKEIINNN
ncbi:MAG TPA: ParA family protein [Acholeplasmataceae bacterium]|jgi:chromosome partitioning protein|nr:ParA family protein [Acholeplasmataceae bacterium]